MNRRGKNGRQGGSERSSRTNLLDAAGRVVMGRHAIEELILHSPERIIEARYQQGGDQRKGKIIGQLQSLKIRCLSVTDEELSKLCRSESHQGIAALVKARPERQLKALLKDLADRSALLLMLDNIQDPQNLGAILRAAECFNVDAVVWSRNRGASVTPVTTRASVGASELIEWIEVGNLHEALLSCKEAGFWSVGAIADPGSEKLQEFSFPERAVIVMGSEESGLQPLVQREIDFKVYIPMLGRISSLNVSQATAVMLYEARRRKAGK